ncbi:hypothetical protein NIES46_39960 [Arthrospira platensis NIES-46]|uniref:Uncharacterized protein n=1 Tax=Limnospira platensis NIES-46 TaxID=1236695 RepID=A0A5M3TD08_LIMPL|nr:hypothetical protein NIES46_39960 [Arthrospira platensis NIES-46]
MTLAQFLQGFWAIEGGFRRGFPAEDIGVGVEVGADELDLHLGIVQVLGGVLHREELGWGGGLGAVVDVVENLATGGVADPLAKAL